MKQVFYLSAIVLALFSCTNGQEETVDFNELSKPSEKYNGQSLNTDSVVSEETYFDSLSVVSQKLIDTMQWEKKNIFRLDTLIFPDRFGAKTAEKWYYLSQGDSLVFMRWTFQNGVKCRNTFFNWLDCYGPRCKSIRVGENAAFSPRAILLLHEDKQLIFMESGRKIDPVRYLKIMGELGWGKKWSYIICQAPRKKAEWMTSDEKGTVIPQDICAEPEQKE